MRDINEIIVHCADTRINQSFSVEDVRRWHVEERGWSDCGYHYYLPLGGGIEIGRPLEIQGAHCKVRNKNTVGVCFEGGKKEDGSMWDKPTSTQLASFYILKSFLMLQFGKLDINPHSKYSSKTCPNFNTEILKYLNNGVVKHR